MATQKSRSSKHLERKLAMQEARHDMEWSLQTIRHNTESLRLQVDYLVDQVQILGKRNAASSAGWMFVSLFLGILVGVGGNLMATTLSNRFSSESINGWGLGLMLAGLAIASLIGLRTSSQVVKEYEKYRAVSDKKANLDAPEDHKRET